MIRVKYVAPNFTLPIRAGKDTIDIKFDTGANKTVLSCDIFTKMFGVTKTELMAKLMSAKFEVFQAASGDEIHGVPLKMSDVYLGGMYLKEFYFTLIIDAKKSVKLLGDDFISCCSFSHSIGGDIIITAFDEKRYINIPRNTVMTTDELYELLQEAESINSIKKSWEISQLFLIVSVIKIPKNRLNIMQLL